VEKKGEPELGAPWSNQPNNILSRKVKRLEIVPKTGKKGQENQKPTPREQNAENKSRLTLNVHKKTLKQMIRSGPKKKRGKQPGKQSQIGSDVTKSLVRSTPWRSRGLGRRGKGQR